MAHFIRPNTSSTNARFDRSNESQSGSFVCGTSPVTTRSYADNFRVDICSTSNCMLIAFHDERRCAFANDGSIALKIEGATGSGGIVSSL
jgi:hypothetical protein